MMAYKIMLVMLIFCAVNSGLNSLNWYSTKLPVRGAIITEAQVTDFTASVGTSDINPLTVYSILKLVYQVIGSGLLSLLSIIPFLMSMGVPLDIATMVQIPVWLVLVMGIYGMWTGHVTTSQE